MRKFSRLVKLLPAGLCALALVACGKSQNQQTYIVPDDGPKVDAKNLDAKATSLRLADAAYASGAYAMAAQLYFHAAELQPDEPAVPVKLGFALFKAGSPADAEKVFRAALAKDAKNHDALRGLAHSLVTQGRAADALPVYRQAIAAGGMPDARIYSGLGAALDMIGKHEEARAAYQAGLKLAPQDIGLRNNLALSYAMSGDTEKARAILAGMAQNPAAAPRARESLSTINAIVAGAAHSAPKAHQLAAGPASRPALTPAAAGIDTPRPAETREVAEVPAPVRATRISRKAGADLPIADAGDGEVFIRTGRATAVRADARRTALMSLKGDAETPEDAAAEVLELLAQAERGPRFVWQEARRPDPS